ncbi:hypothetical protein Ddye_014477 [Dipteronia dyeriana]|uniref:TauD/TfdA-like domain-containing protein n=1 Tax=Dipteronia dyeriana TaxID=168575 RepID=A0AAD9X8F7_9ROSI|nr:hypothetical protein Ddye_014477 [Dipteronia dyeriana]
MADHFTEIQLPQQRNYNSIPFPSVLSPNPSTKAAAVPCSVSNLIETIKSRKLFLESLLLKTGAILFRGFDVKTAEDFHDVVEAFRYEDFPSFGGTALGTQVFGQIFTANESPPDQNMGFHQEMVQTLQSPSKLLFFCEVEPASGGETPIVLSHIVYERMRPNYPEFVEKLEDYRLILSRFLGQDDDPSSPIGSSRKSTFSTDNKSVAEERFVI